MFMYSMRNMSVHILRRKVQRDFITHNTIKYRKCKEESMNFNMEINECTTGTETYHTASHPLRWHTQQFHCIAMSSVCTTSLDTGTRHSHRNLHSVSNSCPTQYLLSISNTFTHPSIYPFPLFCLKPSHIIIFACTFTTSKHLL